MLTQSFVSRLVRYDETELLKASHKLHAYIGRGKNGRFRIWRCPKYSPTEKQVGRGDMDPKLFPGGPGVILLVEACEDIEDGEEYVH